jgi:hypothetical protein
MSMSSHFVEIRPELIKRLKREPLLADTVVLSDLRLPSDDDISDDDIDAIIRPYSPAQQQHIRAVLSADVDGIIAALKKLVPRKQWQVLQAHISAMTKEELLKQAAEKREGLLKDVRQIQSVLRSVAQQKVDSRPIPDGGLGERICIDKAWGGLHYLLCSVTDTGRQSLSLAVLGGTEIGEDHGYGPARYLSASQVKAVAAALSAMTHETLRQRYDAAAMNEAGVYPGRWEDGHDNDSLDWLLQAFDELRRFYQGAADRGNAVIKYLR